VGLVDIILLGILEGLTEFLPVSSTGHLILLSDLLGHNSDASKALDVVIQLGAVLAVAVYFRARLFEVARSFRTAGTTGRGLLVALTIAFVPVAVIGLALHAAIKQHLFGSGPVAAALIVGGLLMIGVERWRSRRGVDGDEGVAHVTPRRALWIGLCQCLSLWPGASRAMTTIVAGQLGGLNTKTSAEFSFLLAIPTLGAATLYDLAKNGHLILALPSGGMLLAVGMVVSFVVALLVVAVFLRYVSKVGMVPFGIYRIALGAAVLLWA
jgi:undecaprenyl-diphosphatase